MHRDNPSELDLGLDSRPVTPSSAPPKLGLTIPASANKPLSGAQIEFNKRMKALEKARAVHERERARLDEELRICITELMPLVETMNQGERDLILAAGSCEIR